MNSLLHINVNDNTEKKNGLTYLSWAWAWAECLKSDPCATWGVVTYSEQPYMRIGESAMVHTWVTLNGLRRDCMLPVMDHRNKAINNPDAFAVNTAIMRCMTKAISMHGLGLYIYAGEDLPQADAPESPEQAAEREQRERRGAELDELVLWLIDAHEHGKDMDAIRVWYTHDTWSTDAADRSEEQKYVWSNLNRHSKLRSAIKANKPPQAGVA
jgi:hypothetical protein